MLWFYTVVLTIDIDQYIGYRQVSVYPEEAILISLDMNPVDDVQMLYSYHRISDDMDCVVLNVRILIKNNELNFGKI